MALCGKKILEVKIRSDTDVFYQLFTTNQEDLPSLSPANLQKTQIVRCHEVGTVGTIVIWTYFLGVEVQVGKTLISDSDEEKGSVTYNVFGGDLRELYYKSLVVIFCVKTNGSVNVVKWTIEYEKRNPYVPDPDALVDFFRRFTKDIDMAMSGKKVEKVKFKCDGDFFYKVWTSHQEALPCLTPTNYQRIKVLGCEVGIVGTLLLWNYTVGGKEQVQKTLTIDADEGKKSVTYKLLEGDITNLYKTFIVNIRVENDCSGNLVIWTIEYVKRNAKVPDPDAIVDFVTSVTRDIEMAICGEKVVDVKIKSDCDFFYKLWTSHQEVIPCLTTNIRKCQIMNGEVRNEGKCLLWNYFLDEKVQAAKTVIFEKDEEKKSVSYRIIEGDILELYKTYVMIIGVETDGSVNRVTWTLKYEKLNHKVPDPDALLGDFYIKLTKDIEAHQLQN